MTEKQVRSPKTLIGLGVVLVILGLVAIPWVVNDPTESTGRGIPIWFAVIGLVLGGLYVIGLGWVHLRRGKR